MRKVIAVALSLAVQGAALTGPLVHAHPDDHASEHHRGRTVHTHWAAHAPVSHPADMPAVGTDDHDRAVFLNAFVAVAPSLIPAPGVVHGVFNLFVPAESLTYRRLDVVRSHDPPVVRPPSARAPPAHLS